LKAIRREYQEQVVAEAEALMKFAAASNPDESMEA
jgi:hypothetical protein